MYSALTPNTSTPRCAPPPGAGFERALQRGLTHPPPVAAIPAPLHQNFQQQQPQNGPQQPQHGHQLLLLQHRSQQPQHGPQQSVHGPQQLLQERQHAVAGAPADVGCPAANSLQEAGLPPVRGRRQHRVHKCEPPSPGRKNRVNATGNEREDVSDGSPRSMEEACPASPAVTAAKPGFLSRLLRPGRGEQKRSRSSPSSNQNGHFHPGAAVAATGRSLTPPASASSFRPDPPTAYPPEKSSEPCSSQFTPWQGSHQQPLLQQRQPIPNSLAAVRGGPFMTPPACCSRRASPFSSAPRPLPVTDQTLAGRGPVSAGASCIPLSVAPVPAGVPACQHGFMQVRHPALAVNGGMCPFPPQQQQLQKQSFVAAGAAGHGLSAPEDTTSSNGVRIPRQVVPPPVFDSTVPAAEMSHKKPSVLVPSFGLCSPMTGCFPVPGPYAVSSVSEASTAATEIPPAQRVLPAPLVPVHIAGGTGGTVKAPSRLAAASGGRGKAVLDPEALNKFSANCFFTQMYLLDSAKRLELIAARISHSMQSRAFSHWVLKHRYPIAKQIWNRKVAKEVEHLRRLQNNLERSRQNYAAETARKRSEANAGALDKNAELLIIQEQQREALAEQQAAADEQLERVQRYRVKRAAVLGSLLLEHGLKRLLYNHKSFSLFALRSNLLTDNDILQHAVHMLPKFVPPAWQQLEPARQAELLKKEYAHLVDPATIHLTNLREMYRLHRLDLEARSKRLACYYRRYFSCIRSFTILECVQRSQRRRLLSEAFALLRHYSWTIRALQEESLACSAAIGRLREAEEQPGSFLRCSSSNPLVFSSCRRRRQYNCGPSANSTRDYVRTAPDTAAAAAEMESQIDASMQQQCSSFERPGRTSSVLAGKSEMSGIFFSRNCDGSPIPPRRGRPSSSRSTAPAYAQQQSNTTWGGGPVVRAASVSRRGSPSERCSCCNNLSAGGVQVSCSCCGQSQPEDAGAPVCNDRNSNNNSAFPPRGPLCSSEGSLPSPATAAAPRPCVLASSPVTADTDATGTAAAAAAAVALHHRCAGTEGSRMDELCTLQSSESLWTHGSAATRPQEASSAIPSPVCIVRDRHRTRPSAPLHDCSAVTETAPQQQEQRGSQSSPRDAHQRQQPQELQQLQKKGSELHQSCFLEAGAIQANKLRRGCSSPACVARASPTRSGQQEAAAGIKSSYFLEAGALQTNRLKRGSSSPARLTRSYSPKPLEYETTAGNRPLVGPRSPPRATVHQQQDSAGETTSFPWPRSPLQAAGHRQQQSAEAAAAARNEVGGLQGLRRSCDTVQDARARPTVAAERAAAAAGAPADFDYADAAAEKMCAPSVAAAVPARQVSTYISAAGTKSSKFQEEQPKSGPVNTRGTIQSLNSAANDMSPSARSATSASAGKGQRAASAAQEAERNAAVILGAGAELRRNNGKAKAAPPGSPTTTSNHEKQRIGYDASGRRGSPQAGKVHLVGRSRVAGRR